VALDTAYLAETPEGIALSLSPAGLVARFWALLIDSLIKLALWVALLVFMSFAGGLRDALVFIGFFAIEWIYPIAFELAMGGATPGKRVLGLQVVMDSGLPVTPAASITRNVLRAADFLPALYTFGAASILLRRDFKRLGDLAAGTIVVHATPVLLHSDLPAGAPVAPARPLSLREQAAIVSWAGRAGTLTAERLEELAHLARPVMPSQSDQNAARASRAGHAGDSAVLLGIAQWLIGRREGAES
jgi:uncharacterized RDD family membrane protein YckC